MAERIVRAPHGKRTPLSSFPGGYCPLTGAPLAPAHFSPVEREVFDLALAGLDTPLSDAERALLEKASADVERALIEEARAAVASLPDRCRADASVAKRALAMYEAERVAAMVAAITLAQRARGDDHLAMGQMKTRGAK